MSNYPPTPAFGGGFSISRFSKPQTVPRINQLSANLNDNTTVPNRSQAGHMAMTDVQYDREEGELSDRDDQHAVHESINLVTLSEHNGD